LSGPVQAASLSVIRTLSLRALPGHGIRDDLLITVISATVAGLSNRAALRACMSIRGHQTRTLVAAPLRHRAAPDHSERKMRLDGCPAPA
jgi:hypothetical protein